MGEVAAVEFISYEATLEKFQQEWLEIVKGVRKYVPDAGTVRNERDQHGPQVMRRCVRGCPTKAAMRSMSSSGVRCSSSTLSRRKV